MSSVQRLARLAAILALTLVLVGWLSSTTATATYVLTRTVDKNGAPLTITQLGRRIFLPVIFRR